MAKMFKGKNILFGVTGSIAVYKVIDVIRALVQEGANVSVIMTEASCKFITPLCIESTTGCKVFTDMFKDTFSHIELARKADLFVIAPATANIINKSANGIADDLLSTALLVYRGPLIFAPAMNWRMYENPVTQKNLQYLKTLGAKTVGPEPGLLACGEEGLGRMSEPDKIIEHIRSALTQQDMLNERVLVTAGPTREHIDPIRFISNRSSGKMGYAIARAAARRGAEVTLISGPTYLKIYDNIKLIEINSSDEMYNAVMENLSYATMLIMAAAVADYKPVKTFTEKIHKSNNFIIEFTQTKDILYEVGHLSKRPFVVGFSAETGPKVDRAKEKLFKKNIDMIVFNDISKSNSGFDVDTNEVVIIDRLEQKELPLMSKEEVAMEILNRAMQLKNF
ncbi:MAG: bifunctional phosphopantothenoylcysteine decarboxylase/phosphopantothenate--cysteine ligase CoaBC [Thermodesulfovibrionales bacterium]|nr:bifunctional phosphopantothenoylcysteine decarboxylase/phosphopantothenate--cysteine ligase CoaBC [Thermodesulfovibrionales bacterium]